MTAEARAELTARASYGRLLAVLAAPTGDIAAAEDALADAFERALTTWPTDGVPDNPEGWLLTVARNRLKDLWKSAAVRLRAPLDDTAPGPGTVAGWPAPASAGLGAGLGLDALEAIDDQAIPDKRIELLCVCAHPAIDPAVRTPLMLHTVLGLTAAEIAAAYALPEKTIAQRLVRAKRRIRATRIPFVLPSLADLPRRLPAVLEAVYGAYAVDWSTADPDARAAPDSLAGEALYLAETLAALLPDEPEVLGLAALLALSIARVPARTSSTGELIALDDQDPALWDTALIGRGEYYLRRARRLGRIGRFQLEAAIQSVHCDRARSGSTNWPALKALHEALVRLSPTAGARVALAAVVGETDGAAAGLTVLEELGRDMPGTAEFQPWWATRAHLLVRAGWVPEARAAYERAIELAGDERLRAALRRQAATLAG
ncbi:RNA polymerase sigma factor [Cryobacterium sp. AP23]